MTPMIWFIGHMAGREQRKQDTPVKQEPSSKGTKKKRSAFPLNFKLPIELQCPNFFKMPPINDERAKTLTTEKCKLLQTTARPQCED